MKPRHLGPVLAAVLVVAALSRIAEVAAVLRIPPYELLMVDARAYHERALAIAGGDWLGGRVFYQDPLYPYLLAVLYRLFGTGPASVLVLQAALGLATVAATTLLAARIAGAGAALIAGLLAALYRPFLFYESVLLKTSLATLLVALAWLAVHPRHCPSPSRPGPRRGRALAAGALLGMAILCQGQAWAFLPFLLLAAAERSRRTALAVMLGVALALLPVTLRNRIVGGEWVLTTSQLGQNFYTGNGPHVVDGRYRSPEFVRPNPNFEEADFLARGEEMAGHPLTPAEASGFWLKQGLEWAGTHPGRFLANLARKLREVANAYEAPDNFNLALERQRLRPLDLPLLVSFGMLAPIGLAGAFFGIISGDRRRLGLGLAALSYLALVAVFFVFSRYRVPVVPLLCVLAAALVVDLVAAALRREWRRLILGLALVLVMTVLVHLPVAPVGLAQARLNLARARAEEAVRRRQAGLLDEATVILAGASAEAEIAATLEPTWGEPLFVSGMVAATRGDPAAAEQAFREAARRDPRHIPSRVLLVHMLRLAGRPAEAEALWDEALRIDPRAAEDALAAVVSQ